MMYLMRQGAFNWLPDKQYLQLRYMVALGRRLHLKHPKTFTEKLQWLKLYNRKPIYTQMVDKCEAKKYVASVIGSEHIIPTLGVWERFDDIDFDALPDQFVLKCTHDSGGLVICRDKAALDKVAAKRKIEQCLKRNFYLLNREWPYKDVKPRIIAEPFLSVPYEGGLRDYKFYCFDGKAKVMQLLCDRETSKRGTFYNMQGRQQPFNTARSYVEATGVELPATMGIMEQLANTLSEGMPFLRVDFYEVNGHPYFGELTFSPCAGFNRMEPEVAEAALGK